jgi:phosphatidylglycerophosphate synthase
MSASSLLLVAPDGPAAVPPETELLGLPIIRRTALAAKRAGFSRVAVAGASPESPLARALEGTDVERLAAGEPAPDGALVLPWNRVLRTGELRQLAAARPASEVGVAVASEADLPAAEVWLLQGLIRDTEGYMSRRFERPISLAVSRRLANTSVTPNQMTLVSVAIGLFGALFFLSQRPAMQTAGALLFLLHSILDGCDGELARLKMLESRFGGVLDFWGDNVVHAAIFACMAVGWYLATRASWPLALGALAVGGTLLSAGFVYVSTMRGEREGPLFVSVTSQVDGAVSWVADALGRRDFIYLVIALSFFGKARWFLVAAAAGAPIFFLVLVALEWRRARKKAR